MRPSARHELVELLRWLFDVSERPRVSCRGQTAVDAALRAEPARARWAGRDDPRSRSRANLAMGIGGCTARGFEVGQRLVRRIHSQDGLSARRRRRRRLKPFARCPSTMPSTPDEGGTRNSCTISLAKAGASGSSASSTHRRLHWGEASRSSQESRSLRRTLASRLHGRSPNEAAQCSGLRQRVGVDQLAFQNSRSGWLGIEL